METNKVPLQMYISTHLYIKYIFYFISIFSFNSCSTFTGICQHRNENEFDKFFQCYDDSIVFSYKRDITYKSDEELIYPIPFTITLPAGIVDYYYVNSQEFVFYYKYDQLIYIRIDLRHPDKRNQTQYYPTKVEVDSILFLSDTEAGKIYDLQVDLIKRRNLIIEKDNFTILLCNLKKRNFVSFIHTISKSKLLIP